MIVRIWRGWARPEDTEAYAEYILATGIAEYEATPGNRGAYVTRGQMAAFLHRALG